MATEREKKEAQENALYESQLALEAISTGKTAELVKYLKMMNKKYENGMSNDEVDAVIKRAKEAVQEL